MELHKAWLSHINLSQLGKISSSIAKDQAVFPAVSVYPGRYIAFLLLILDKLSYLLVFCFCPPEGELCESRVVIISLVS